MASTTTTTTTIVPPVRVEPAYSDRDAVWRAVISHGPYPLMAAGAGYRELMGDLPLSPFFRTLWASDGIAIDAETESLLHHEPFIGAARELYGAKVVRPSNLIVNVMGPMQDGGRHVDTPTFRGLPRAVVPIWLLVVMGMSGLFERWAVRVAGALTWFYDNPDGEFEYWPHGLDAAPEIERGPYGNVALVADNDLMYHHVRPIGDADAFERAATLSIDSAIHPVDDGMWEIRDHDATIITLVPRDVRVSLLWKAITFPDERSAAVHDEHDDDLDLDAVARIFATDLTRRGAVFSEPEDPLCDPAWAKVLTSTYMPGAN
jgi:hypothetical protein